MGVHHLPAGDILRMGVHYLPAGDILRVGVHYLPAGDILRVGGQKSCPRRRRRSPVGNTRTRPRRMSPAVALSASSGAMSAIWTHCATGS